MQWFHLYVFSLQFSCHTKFFVLPIKKKFYIAKIKWNNLCQIEESHKIGTLCGGHFPLSKTEGLWVICTLEVAQGPLQQLPKQVA